MDPSSDPSLNFSRHSARSSNARHGFRALHVCACICIEKEGKTGKKEKKKETTSPRAEGRDLAVYHDRRRPMENRW